MRDEVNQTCAISLHNWLDKYGTSSDAATNAPTETTDLEEVGEVSEITACNLIETESIQVLENKKKEEEAQAINLNDPPSWPLISDKIRFFLVEHGPDQGKNADFRESALEDSLK